MDETPRTLIRALARTSTSAVPREGVVRAGRDTMTAGVAPVASRRQRGGGGAMSFGENETPRRLISKLAADLSTASDAAGEENAADRRNRKRQRNDSSITTSNTPKDARAAIKGFMRVAKTDSLEKSMPGGPPQDDEFYQSEGEASEPEAEAVGTTDDEKILTEQELEEEGPPKLIGLKRKPKDKLETAILQRRAQARKPGEIPYNKTVGMFKSFLGALPRPNRPTPLALEEAHLALNQYLERAVRDYSRLARIDDASKHNLTKARVEQLLREQGLLVRPVGDEIRRLLHREDADVILGLPVSRARASRV